jgi:hypothetical protein
MEQHRSSSFRIKQYIPYILVILLVSSLALNIYQYWVSANKKLVWKTFGQPITLYADPYNTGGLSVWLEKGLAISPNSKFNVTVGYHRPLYITQEETTLNKTIRIFGRYLPEEYSTTPLVEGTFVLHKPAENKGVDVIAGTYTLTAPSSRAVTYVYKVWCGTVTENASVMEYMFEFAVWLRSGTLVDMWQLS